MPKKSSSPRKTSPVAANGSRGDSKPAHAQVDQIRDIIFGSQMAEYERRFLDLEERLVRDAAALRSEVSSKLDNIQAALLTQVTDQRDLLVADAKRQADAVGKLSERVNSMTAELGARSLEIMETLSGKVEAESSDRLVELARMRGELLKLVEERTAHLSKTKADRAMIAKLFSAAASKLTDEQPSKPRRAKRSN